MQSTRPGWWVYVAVAILLVLGAGLLLYGTPGEPTDPGSQAVAPRGKAPGWVNPTLAGRSPDDPPPRGAPTAASANSELQSRLHSLQRAVNAKDNLVIYDAIAALARVVCALPEEAPKVLATAVEEAGNGSTRYASAIVHALGRCEDEALLRLLVQTLRSERVSAALRDALVISLAQRREVELSHRSGPGFSKGDTHVDAPIQEAFVREALLELLDDALRAPAAYRGRETLSNCLFALGASAAADDRVLDRFRRLARDRLDLAGTVLLALELSKPNEAILKLAREFLFLESAREDTVRQAVALLMRADPEIGFSTVADVLSGDNVPDLRKSWIVAALPALPIVPDELVGHLEQVTLIIETWVSSTRTVTAPGPKSAGPEGATQMPRRVDLQLVFGMFLRSAVVAVRGRSQMIADLGAASLVYWLEHTPGLTPRQVKRLLSVQLAAGGAPLAGKLLDTLEQGKTSVEARFALLVACRDANFDDSDWAGLRPRVQALADRLPEEQRTLFEEGAE